MESKNFIFLILTIGTLIGDSEAALKVHQNLDQCQKQGSVTLRCDFENTHEIVILEPDLVMPGITPIEVIYIHNVQTLSIPKPICADMTFENVNRITLNPNGQCSVRLMTIKLIDSQINDVPRQLDRLELKRSKAERVKCDMGLRKLLISESTVGDLTIPWPIGGDITLKIEHSTIHRFSDMKLEEKVFLMVSNTTIDDMPPNSLTIGSGASANFWYSTVKGSENSIILKDGAKLAVKELSGILYTSVSKSGHENVAGKRPPGVPQPRFPGDDDEDDESILRKRCPSRHTPLLIWLIPTLVATAEAFILIAMCGLLARKPKDYRSKTSESHSGGGGGFNAVQIEGIDPYQNNAPSSYNPNDPNSYYGVRKR